MLKKVMVLSVLLACTGNTYGVNWTKWQTELHEARGPLIAAAAMLVEFGVPEPSPGNPSTADKLLFCFRHISRGAGCTGFFFASYDLYQKNSRALSVLAAFVGGVSFRRAFVNGSWK